MGAGSCGQGDGDGDGLQPSCHAAALARGLVYRVRVTGRARPRALSCAGERRRELGISGAGWEQELLGPTVQRGEQEQGPWCCPITGRGAAWGWRRESLGCLLHRAQRTVPLMLASAAGTGNPVRRCPCNDCSRRRDVWYLGPSSCTEIFMPTSL